MKAIDAARASVTKFAYRVRKDNLVTLVYEDGTAVCGTPIGNTVKLLSKFGPFDDWKELPIGKYVSLRDEATKLIYLKNILQILLN